MSANYAKRTGTAGAFCVCIGNYSLIIELGMGNWELGMNVEILTDFF